MYNEKYLVLCIFVWNSFSLDNLKISTPSYHYIIFKLNKKTKKYHSKWKATKNDEIWRDIGDIRYIFGDSSFSLHQRKILLCQNDFFYLHIARYSFFCFDGNDMLTICDLVFFL